MNILALIIRDTPLKRTSAFAGGEYSGPCPLCRCGTDRFKVWPERGRWACLGPKAGRSGCDRGGDAIQYLRDRDGLTYRQACEQLGINANGYPQPAAASDQRSKCPQGSRQLIPPAAGDQALAHRLTPPNPIWQAHGAAWAARCAAMLWSEQADRARQYLHRRGLHDEVLRAFNVGYNPQDAWEEHAQWGLDKPEDGARHVWIPRGVTFPWYVGGCLWRLNVRRPLTPAQLAAGQAKYIGPAGFANALYNAAALSPPRRPAILVEGEIDALTIVQACGDTIAAVATGSTAGGRRGEWIAQLALAPVVLLAFDVDDAGRGLGAGDKAAAWWLHTLPNAVRWRPLAHDVNSLPDPDIVRQWAHRGLDWAWPGGRRQSLPTERSL